MWGDDHRQARLGVAQQAQQFHHVPIGDIKIDHGEIVRHPAQRVRGGGRVGGETHMKLAGIFQRLFDIHHEGNIGIDQ